MYIQEIKVLPKKKKEEIKEKENKLLREKFPFPNDYELKKENGQKIKI